MRWGEKETYQFVKLYMNQENLWNPDHSDYKSKEIRSNSYKEIIDQFKSLTGISLYEAEVKVKVKNLRSTYSQELAKIRNRSGPESSYKPNLKWFADMHRCLSNLSKNKVAESLFEVQNSNDDSNEKVWMTPNEDSFLDDTQGDPFVGDDDNYVLVMKTEPNEMAHEEPRSHKIKKKKTKYCSQSSDNSDQSFRLITDSSCVGKEDEFDIYGKYIASQLRKMDVRKALRLQIDIQSLVSEARISDLNDSLQ